jgi:hypothetical protein
MIQASPVLPKAPLLPGDDRAGLDEGQRPLPACLEAREPRPEEAVCEPEARSRHRPPEPWVFQKRRTRHGTVSRVVEKGMKVKNFQGLRVFVNHSVELLSWSEILNSCRNLLKKHVESYVPS